VQRGCLDGLTLASYEPECEEEGAAVVPSHLVGRGREETTSGFSQPALVRSFPAEKLGTVRPQLESSRCAGWISRCLGLGGFGDRKFRRQGAVNKQPLLPPKQELIHPFWPKGLGITVCWKSGCCSGGGMVASLTMVLSDAKSRLFPKPQLIPQILAKSSELLDHGLKEGWKLFWRWWWPRSVMENQTSNHFFPSKAELLPPFLARRPRTNRSPTTGRVVAVLKRGITSLAVVLRELIPRILARRRRTVDHGLEDELKLFQW